MMAAFENSEVPIVELVTVADRNSSSVVTAGIVTLKLALPALSVVIAKVPRYLSPSPNPDGLAIELAKTSTSTSALGSLVREPIRRVSDPACV